MLNWPPPAQPRFKIEHALKSSANRIIRLWRNCWRSFQIVSRPGNSKQAKTVSRALARKSSLALEPAAVIVLIVTTDV